MPFDPVRSVVKKVAQYMADVLEDSRDKVQENLLANGGETAATAQGSIPLLIADGSICYKQMFFFVVFFFSLTLVDLITYITRFQWDMAKYPIKQSLKNISDIVSKVSLIQLCRLHCIVFKFLNSGIYHHFDHDMPFLSNC